MLPAYSMAELLVQKLQSFPSRIRVPGDKSISHRSAMFAALAQGVSRVDGFLPSEDCLSTLHAMRAMGAEVREISRSQEQGMSVEIEGCGLRLRPPAGVLDCGNSGTTIRLLSGIIAGQGFEAQMIGDASLSKRPMKRIADPLRLMGASVEGQGEKICPPITVRGGQLHPIRYELPMASAQVKSAILLAGLFAPGVTTVVEPVATRNHTERIMSHFGIEWWRDGLEISVRGLQGRPFVARDLVVPGDISSAAFWMVLAAASAGRELLLENVGLNETRNGIIAVLERMGATISTQVQSADGEPRGDVLVRGGRLRATRIGGAEIPNVIDELPIIAVAAAMAEGTTRIQDAQELRVKETDRIAVVAESLRAMGVTVREFADGMEIDGAAELHGAEITSHHDHRIAMAFTIAGLMASGQTRILGSDCIATSYPGFERHLAAFQGGA